MREADPRNDPERTALLTGYIDGTGMNYDPEQYPDGPLRIAYQEGHLMARREAKAELTEEERS